MIPRLCDKVKEATKVNSELNSNYLYRRDNYKKRLISNRANAKSTATKDVAVLLSSIEYSIETYKPLLTM